MKQISHCYQNTKISSFILFNRKFSFCIICRMDISFNFSMWLVMFEEKNIKIKTSTLLSIFAMKYLWIGFNFEPRKRKKKIINFACLHVLDISYVCGYQKKIYIFDELNVMWERWDNDHIATRVITIILLRYEWIDVRIQIKILGDSKKYILNLSGRKVWLNWMRKIYWENCSK